MGFRAAAEATRPTLAAGRGGPRGPEGLAGRDRQARASLGGPVASRYGRRGRCAGMGILGWALLIFILLVLFGFIGFTITT